MALQWNDVDYINGVFTFRRAISRRKVGAATEQGQDNNLPVVGWFATFLRETPRGLPDQPVFVNPEASLAKKTTRRYTADFLIGDGTKPVPL